MTGFKAKASSSADNLAKPSDSYVQSFARGLKVMCSFDASAPALTLSQVAQKNGIPNAGARRILLTLVQLGYVQVDGNLFRLKPKVLDIGFAYLSSQPFWHQAQPIMESLALKLRLSYSATVLEGDSAVIVMRVPAHKIMSINLSVGSRLPAFCSSLGRVLLAGQPTEVVNQILTSKLLIPLTTKTVTDPVAVLKIIERVRKQGWALVEEEVEYGLISLAVPLIDRNSRVVAAVNVSGPKAYGTSAKWRKDVLPQLIEASQQINHLIRAY
jgi:IclR family pca regulon transcriptional regulator